MSQMLQAWIKNYYIIFFLLIFVAAYFFWNKGNGLASGTKKMTVADIVFCLAAALLVSFKFDLCPLVGQPTRTDSSVFIYIGKQMLQGARPYVDLFDHKGILLYIIQILGLSLTPGSLVGVWIIELISIALTAFILYRIALLFINDRLIIYVALVGVLIGCGTPFYEGGNYTESYALPWISLALYIFLKYFSTGLYRFHEIVLLGVGFAAVLFLRVNMVAVWAAFMPVILIQMICRQKWKDLGVCAGGFVLGIAILTAPLFAYMLWSESLQEMISCYLTFNFAYSAVSLGEQAEAFRFFVFDNKLLAGALLISLASGLKDKKYLYNLFGLLVSLLVISVSGREYRHYGIILIPLMLAPYIYSVLSLYSLASRVFKFPALPLKSWLVVAASILVVIVVGALTFAVRGGSGISDIDAYLQNHTEPGDDVLILGNDVEYYLENDLTTKNRFFYQFPVIDVSDEIYELFLKELEVHPSDIIVAPFSKDTYLNSEDNMGEVCRYLEQQSQNGLFTCEDMGSFYVYKRTEKG